MWVRCRDYAKSVGLWGMPFTILAGICLISCSHLFTTGFYRGTGESAGGLFFSWVDPQT